MPIAATELIWMNGRLVPWSEAKVHVLAHVVHYASSVFDGIRCYDMPKGPTAFRLRDHVRRLLDSARIYRLPVPYGLDDLVAASRRVVQANRLRACYIRPVVFRGYGEVGVNPAGCPVEVAIAAWEWGAYLGAEALTRGVDVQVSSWTRIAPDTLPALAKSAANYANSQLIKMEALANGFAEGIALDAQGMLAEGSGENLFLVRDGEVATPQLDGSVLPGITRATVITLARELGFPVAEKRLPRESLYVADEVFLTGTAAEITPVRSVDRVPVGSGQPGPVTLAVQAALRGIVSGAVEDRHGWLTPVG